MNKNKPHLYVIPEDDRDRQLADGFVLHDRVDTRRVQVMPPAGGWSYVLKTFQREYVKMLRGNPQAHVVMIIDFDGDFENRRKEFDQAVPDEIKARVFVVGPKHTPELLKSKLNRDYEQIGTALADDCDAGETALWEHEELNHNDPDRQRLIQTVKPFLF